MDSKMVNILYGVGRRNNKEGVFCQKPVNY